MDLYIAVKAKEVNCCLVRKMLPISFPHMWILPGLSVVVIIQQVERRAWLATMVMILSTVLNNEEEE
jgi:hypothetical protein